jgi:Transglutaminase-like superfamily
MALLLLARSLIALVPLRYWRDRLGKHGPNSDKARASRFAALVERAAWRLPLETKCLPRAMALSWMLRREAIGHCVTLALRPPDLRGSADMLHAWVELDGLIVLGELPGPWLVIHQLPAEA